MSEQKEFNYHLENIVDQVEKLNRTLKDVSFNIKVLIFVLLFVAGILCTR